MRVLSVIASLAVVAAFRPGVPPQCFPDSFCIFHRYDVGGVYEYSWDLTPLCAPAGAEYKAIPSGSSTAWPAIIFNICGTVNKAIAPYNVANAPANVQLPLPHSHGVAVQYIDDPANDQGYTCSDIDTCDQDTNPLCTPGSLNYDPNRNGDISPATGLPNNHNPAREARCATTPTLYYCYVQTVPCTDNSEILAYYDGGDSPRFPSGSPPVFQLYDETNANAGINLTYIGAKNYLNDPFACSVIDPATGEPTERTVNIYITCDASVSGLRVVSYIEQGQCQYYITASSKYACGTKGDPFDAANIKQSDIPISTTPTRNFFFTMLGAFIVAPAAIFLYNFADGRGYLDPIKNRMPAWMALPSWLGGGGGGGGSSSGSYASSYKAVGTGSTAPVSSAYGSA